MSERTKKMYTDPEAWDWGTQTRRGCSKYTVGFLRPGYGYRVYTCHKTLKKAKSELRGKQKAHQSLGNKIAKGVVWQVRNKKTGVCVFELPVLRPKK